MNTPPLLHEDETLNPWQPVREPVRLAILGKLMEELNELGTIVARCLIQGVDEVEPVTKVPNKAALTNEMADVYASLSLLVEEVDANTDYIAARVERKRKHLKAWHALLIGQQQRIFMGADYGTGRDATAIRCNKCDFHTQTLDAMKGHLISAHGASLFTYDINDDPRR